MDFYELLGVSSTCNNDKLRRAYKEKALEYHPDKNKRPDASELFRKVKEAYNTLSDSRSRLAYDDRRRLQRVHEEREREEKQQKEMMKRQEEKQEQDRLRERERLEKLKIQQMKDAKKARKLEKKHQKSHLQELLRARKKKKKQKKKKKRSVSPSSSSSRSRSPQQKKRKRTSHSPSSSSASASSSLSTSPPRTFYNSAVQQAYNSRKSENHSGGVSGPSSSVPVPAMPMSASLEPFIKHNEHKRTIQEINIWNSRDGSLAASMPDHFSQTWTI